MPIRNIIKNINEEYSIFKKKIKLIEFPNEYFKRNIF